jgi:hypothetical protein
VGGVYVLFIFVSLHRPNPSPAFGRGVELVFLFFIFLVILFLGLGFKRGVMFCDSSHYLCSYFEGFSYCFFCLVLMLGFVAIRVVRGDKDSFCR